MLYVLAGSLLAWPIAARKVVHVVAPPGRGRWTGLLRLRVFPVACTGPAPATASSRPAAGASGSRAALVQRSFMSSSLVPHRSTVQAVVFRRLSRHPSVAAN